VRNRNVAVAVGATARSVWPWHRPDAFRDVGRHAQAALGRGIREPGAGAASILSHTRH